MESRFPGPPLVGRSEEVATLLAHVDDDRLPPVLYLHGQAGIGKTALLEEVRRRRGDRRWAWLEAASAHLDPGKIPAAAFVVLDALHASLDETALRWLASALDDGRRVLVASRHPPGRQWHDDGWDTLFHTLEVGPLDNASSLDLLRELGVEDPDTATELSEWGRGEPLALIAGGEASPSFRPDRPDTHRDVARRLAQDLLAHDLAMVTDLSPTDPILETASVAPAVDAATLAAVAGHPDPDRTVARLASLSVARPVGARLALHPRLRWAIRATMRADRPDRYRKLRRRLADHAAARAAGGEPRFLLELAEMIDDRDLAWGIGSEVEASFRAGPLENGDESQAASRFTDQPGRWQGLRRWFRQAPQHVLAIRDEARTLVGFAVSLGVDDAPAWAAEDPVVAPWLRHARERHGPGEAILLRDTVILAAGAARSEVATVGNAALVTGPGFAVRWLYALIDPDDEEKVRFVDAMGYRRVPALDVADGELILHCYALDLGSSGFVGTTHALVYRHLGLDPPSSGPVRRRDVLDALRAYHEPTALLPSPLGSGATGDERIERVRQRIRTAVEVSFGTDEVDALRRAALERGYLAPGSSHGSAARSLHVSRATYFRRLSEAVDRIADTLNSPGGGELRASRSRPQPPGGASPD